MQTLRIWVGPTHSEKSTRAMRAARRLERHMPVGLIRPVRSIRSYERPGFLVTKGGEAFPSNDVHSAHKIWPIAQRFKAVWIDEPGLFDDEPFLFECVQEMRRYWPVLVSGLSATSELGVFGTSMSKMVSVADEVEWCRADCDGCGLLSSATRSFFKPGRKEQEIVVGGEESYSALCPPCWTADTARVRALAGV